jgi:Flp pilus assembly protein TadG
VARPQYSVHDHMESKQKGATIVEAALVLPLFFLLLLTVFEFGLVFSAYHSMVGAAREGARVAVIPDPNNAYQLPDGGTVAHKVCDKLQAGVFGALGTCSSYPGSTPSSTATCPPFAGGTPPKLTTEDVYVNSPRMGNACQMTVPEGGTEAYVQVAVHRNVRLFWGWQFPLTVRAVMRSEGN